MKLIITTVIFAFVISFVLGVLLGIFQKIFEVKVDPKVTKVRACLPGANCGACGYPGCDGFAAAVVSGKAPCNGCKVGKQPVAEKVQAVMSE
ncbi:MAG: electron transport complex subunit B [Treponema sp.]|nr:electron transport complex subunit B [Candidatus Treponema equifaecale]